MQLAEEFGAEGEVCVTCSSATAGLSAALIASRCTGPVLVPAFTFPATYGAVRAAGLEPLVMDVDPLTWAVTPEALDKMFALTGARGVILVAPFGLQIEFSEHIAVCRRHGAIVVIDCAAGLGVARSNSCNNPAVFEVFSLHATKPLGIGEGGAVFCAEAIAPAVRSALNFGLPNSNKGLALDWGFNGKLSELHAAIGLAQLERYRPMIVGRQRFVEIYQALLGEFPIAFPRSSPMAASWQVFPVLFDSENDLLSMSAELANEGIEVRRYYRPSLSLWPGTRLAESCPVSERLASCMMALPVRSVADASEAEPIMERVRFAMSRIFSGVR